MTVTTALVVPDHTRNDFPTWESVKQRHGFRIGVTGIERAEDLRERLPNADIVMLDTYRPYFQDNRQGLDAIAISAEAGSAWTILYPSYAVVIREPHITNPVAIAIATGDSEFVTFISHWLRLKKTDGTMARLYDTWILGKGKVDPRPPWSIIRNVLHWVE